MYGKTILSWNVPAIHNGNPEEFTRALVDAGFEGVCLKAADGIRVQTTSPSGPWPNWGENIKQELVDALKAAGLKVYFWHFLYGFDSQGEASVAISQCSRFNLMAMLGMLKDDLNLMKMLIVKLEQLQEL